MLTPEEEKERALKVSQLYGKPLPTELKPLKGSVFVWRYAFSAAAFMIAPILVFGGIINLYLSLNYTNLADVQASSILLVALLFANLLLFVKCVRQFSNLLEAHYLGGRLSFWVITVGVMLIAYGLFSATQPSGHQPLLTILLHIGYFAGLLIPIVTVWVVGNVYLLDRLARRS